MIKISHTKVASLNVVTPPGTQETIRFAVFKPGIKWGELKAKVPTPKLNKSAFQHWSLECNGEVIDDEYIFNNSTTIYGVFDGTIVVTFNTGTTPETFKAPVVAGTSVRSLLEVVPKFTKKDHSFIGWSLDNQNIVDPLHRINEATTLTAMWTDVSNSVTLTFDMHGLFENFAQIKVPRGSQWSKIKNGILYPTPNAEGNVFARWSLEDNGPVVPDSTLLNDNKTIHAVGSTAKEFININFDPRGGTPTKPVLHQPKGVLYGYIKQMVDDPTRKTDAEQPDRFAGWAEVELADAELTADHAFQKSTILYAQWITRIDITIKNNGPDRKISKDNSNYWPYSEAQKKFALQEDHIPEEHTFKCWSLSADGPDMGTEGKFSEDTNVFAVYDPYAVITINKDGGESAQNEYKCPINTQWSAIKGKITAPTKADHTFKHWSLSKGGGAIQDNHAFAGKVTIFAVWEPMVSITFNTKEGTPAIPVKKVAKGTKWSAIRGSVAVVTKPGFSFAYWSLSEDGAAVPDEHAFNEANTTLYAKWVNQVTVSFNANGGSPTPSAITVNVGTQWSAIKSQVTSPSKSGHKFKGWEVQE